MADVGNLGITAFTPWLKGKLRWLAPPPHLPQLPRIRPRLCHNDTLKARHPELDRPDGVP
jgi:hypothetical protein